MEYSRKTLEIQVPRYFDLYSARFSPFVVSFKNNECLQITFFWVNANHVNSEQQVSLCGIYWQTDKQKKKESRIKIKKNPRIFFFLATCRGQTKKQKVIRPLFYISLVMRK